MRAVILPLLLAFTLAVAPAVMAAGGEEGKAKAQAAKAAGAERRENATAHEDADKSAERANRTAARESFAENRSALLETFLAGLHAKRASWHENATRVREACHNATFDAPNATKEQREERAHCIRDGYSAWRAEHHADMKELREQMRALLAAFHPGRGASR